MEQLPFAGIMAPTMVTVLAEVVKVPDVPMQVVVGAGDVAMTRLAGTVSVKWDCVKSKPLALVKVMVRVEATFSPTLAGENASVTVGEIGVKVSGVGHAVAAVPADDGALLLVTPFAATVDGCGVGVRRRIGHRQSQGAGCAVENHRSLRG